MSAIWSSAASRRAEVARVELPVTVHEREHLAPRCTQPVADGDRVAALLLVGHHGEIPRSLPHRRAGGADGVVLARVIDEHDLVGPAPLGEHRHDVPEDAPDVLSLVVGRDRQADVDLG